MRSGPRTSCARWLRIPRTPSNSCHVGTPVANCELRIADARGAPSPPGTVGRILIRGDNVSQGYYGDAEATAAARTPDGFLDTGDLGTMHDGELVITGRVKEILFVSGQNHYPQDIELVLARDAGIELGRAAAAGVRPAHAATDDVLVFLLSKGDDLSGFAEQARRVRRGGQRAHGNSVSRASSRCGSFRRRPAARSSASRSPPTSRTAASIEVLAELAALEIARRPAPAANPAATSRRRCLRSARRRWATASSSPDDNLFELGTGSLTLAQIYEKVDAAYPGHLEVTDFFEYPTVRAMASFLSTKIGAAR